MIYNIWKQRERNITDMAKKMETKVVVWRDSPSKVEKLCLVILNARKHTYSKREKVCEAEK